MLQIIDRRLAGKNKSIGNRERFLRRYKEQIREAVKRAVDGRGIRDIERGEEVRIPKKDVSEPVFHHGQGGMREIVHPGNKDYVRGDRIERPKGGGGGGSGKGQASDSGEGEDDFTFALSKEEFMQVFFEDLALPHMIRTQLAETPEWKSQRAGFTGRRHAHQPARACARCAARSVGASPSARVRGANCASSKSSWCVLKRHRDRNDAVKEREIQELEEQIEALRARLANAFPYLDPIDLRFRNRIKVPVPTTKAVMFCLMDVSGSMDEARKDLAKRFFILLYLFLTRHYDKIDLVFIRHHTQAQEVDEENFFHARETGGTVVRSALVLMEEIIRARYSPSEWNIYGAQASDGDNWHHDCGPLPRVARQTSCCRWCAISPTCRWPRKSRTCGRSTRSCPRRHAPLRDAQGDRGRRRSIRCSATSSRKKARRQRHERYEP